MEIDNPACSVCLGLDDTHSSNCPHKPNKRKQASNGAGYSKRNMRMKLARELMADMERTEDTKTRLEQAKVIKELVSGKGHTPNRLKKKQNKPSAFA